MRKEIINKLKEIEKREHVKIIYAIESGSRAGVLSLLIVIMMYDLFM